MTQSLDKYQKNAINLFLAGYNLFITGSGGCGKSFVVKQFIKHYKGKVEDIAVTSTTGISSLNIGGKTIHSWSGITPLTDFTDVDEFVKLTRQNNVKTNNWLFTKVLVIDEVSMLSSQLFLFLDQVAKAIRGSRDPFGGIQVILTGDYELKSITLSDSAKKENQEIINDLIKAAYNNAKENLKKKSAEEISKVTGGIDLPTNFKLPF